MKILPLLNFPPIKWIAILLTIIAAVNLSLNLRQNLIRLKLTDKPITQDESQSSQADQSDPNSSASEHEFEIEKQIREELFMQKEGEVVVQLPPFNTPTKAPTPPPEPTKRPIREWYELFTN